MNSPEDIYGETGVPAEPVGSASWPYHCGTTTKATENPSRDQLRAMLEAGNALVRKLARINDPVTGKRYVWTEAEVKLADAWNDAIRADWESNNEVAHG